MVLWRRPTRILHGHGRTRGGGMEWGKKKKKNTKNYKTGTKAVRLACVLLCAAAFCKKCVLTRGNGSVRSQRFFYRVYRAIVGVEGVNRKRKNRGQRGAGGGNWRSRKKSVGEKIRVSSNDSCTKNALETVF